MNEKERAAWLNKQWRKGRKRMTRTRRDVSKYRGDLHLDFIYFRMRMGRVNSLEITAQRNLKEIFLNLGSKGLN